MQTDNSDTDRDKNQAVEGIAVIAKLGGMVECNQVNAREVLDELARHNIVEYSFGGSASVNIISLGYKFTLLIDNHPYVIDPTGLFIYHYEIPI